MTDHHDDLSLAHALDELEATLTAIWEQADADYEDRHYPWHTRGPLCDQYEPHVHGRRRIIYYPEAIAVDKPQEGL